MFSVSMKARVLALLTASTAALAATAAAQGGLNTYGNPMKHAPGPTTAAITPEELRTRLYIFSDDTMQGRQVATLGNFKGTSYIAGELKRLGVEPGGDNGTYFQRLPYVIRTFSGTPALSANGSALSYLTDFVPVPGIRAPKSVVNAPVIYGGVEGDTTKQISPEQAAGKFVIMTAAPATQSPAGGGRGGRGGGGRGGFGGAGPSAAARFPDAVAVATVNLDELSPAERLAINNPTRAIAVGGRGAPPPPPTGPMPGGVARPNPAFQATSGDIVVTNGRGGIARIRDGKLIAGSLPAGRTAAAIQFSADSIQKVAALVAAGTVVRRDSLNMFAQALMAAGVMHDTSMTFYGERIALDSEQIATLGRGAGGAGGRGGRGGGAGGRGGFGRGGAPAAAEAGPVVAEFRITTAAAARLLGKSVDGMAPGTTGGTATASLTFVEQPSDWARNVIGIVRGSDPKLAAEFVAIGAHNDHNGIRLPAVDHDSLKAFNDELIRREMAVVKGDLRSLTPADRAAIHVNMDSIRKLHPVARMDSVQNGADDDGSGSMGVLEIAEAVAKMPVKPKRSIIFVWHTGEEAGLLGSSYFTANPTVSIDSIVAQINIDMIGRGRAEDMVGGGPNYLGAVGSGRLSTELQKQMLAVNAAEGPGKKLRIDYRFDDPTLGTSVDGKPVSWPGYNNIYGRSDHANYANKCIPIVFFFTGLHGDYHQNTDEPQYIDYPHYSMITSYIRDLLVNVADQPMRPKLDEPCTRR